MCLANSSEKEKKVLDQKDYVVSRLNFFLDKLKEAIDPYDIEGRVYSIMITSESVYKTLHNLNRIEF
jgi:hypothetical protein